MKHWLIVAALATAPLARAAGEPVPATAQATAMTAGEVRKVDRDQGKVTIRHEALANLDMPAMTMVFRVADPAMLDRVSEGDRIRFVAERRDGALTVVAWLPAP